MPIVPLRVSTSCAVYFENGHIDCAKRFFFWYAVVEIGTILSSPFFRENGFEMKFYRTELGAARHESPMLLGRQGGVGVTFITLGDLLAAFLLLGCFRPLASGRFHYTVASLFFVKNMLKKKNVAIHHCYHFLQDIAYIFPATMENFFR